MREEVIGDARLILGDCRDVLATLDAESVQCVVTSPPYYGLRDYGVDGQIGLEPTPAAYVAELVAVFRELRRVLRKDGVAFLNLGDSYANDAKWGGSSGGKHVTALHGNSGIGRGKKDTGLKPKDLIGIPWRVAFALQDDGWYLRNDIIWHKPAPMPESVRDRCTRAHEYVFHLTKSERYFWDAAEIAEPGELRPSGQSQHKYISDDPLHRTKAGLLKIRDKVYETRNARTVWTIGPEPFRDAHYAVMPSELASRCIKAGSRVGDTVLDPFAGAGTTLLAADRLQRHAIGIELNPANVEMARKRVAGDAPILSAVPADIPEPPPRVEQPDIFETVRLLPHHEEPAGDETVKPLAGHHGHYSRLAVRTP